MHPFVDFAVGRRLRVVYVMHYRLQGFDVAKDGGDIFVGHFTKRGPGHDLVNRAGFDVACAKDLGEQREVVIGNPGRVGSNVGAGNAAPRALHNEAAGEVHSGERLTLTVLRGVALRASGNGDKIFAAFFGRRDVGRGDRHGERLRHGSNQIIYRENYFGLGLLLTHWGQRAQVDDDGGKSSSDIARRSW